MAQPEPGCVSPEKRRAYVNGELDPSASNAVEDHCEDCPACSALMDTAFHDAEEASRSAIQERLREPADGSTRLPDWLSEAWQNGLNDLREEARKLCDDTSFAEAEAQLGFVPAAWQREALVERLLDFTSEGGLTWKQHVNVVRDWGAILATETDATRASWFRDALISRLRRPEEWQVRQAAAEALRL